MNTVLPSKRLVVLRCLKYMGHDEDDEEQINNLKDKPFTELHELAKTLKIQISENTYGSILNSVSVLENNHSNTVR